MKNSILSKFYEHLKYCNRRQILKDYYFRYKIDKSVKFGESPILYCPGIISIGEGTHIGNYATIMAYDSMSVTIGKNCAISHYIAIYTMNPNPLNRDKLETGNVFIGDGVWIGHTVYINQGVSIGDGAVVGAHSVVVDDIPPYCVAVGAPARVVRKFNVEEKYAFHAD